MYRLEKRGWSTPDALAALRRRWHIEPRRVSYGGLKDRHAWTIQYLTIFHGPRRDLHHHDVTVTHLGWADAPYTSHDIRCNRFRLTLRDLSAEAVERAAGGAGPASPWRACRITSTTSASARWPARGEEFIARLLVRGRFEDALRLALTAPYEFDRGPIKKEKTLLRGTLGRLAGPEGAVCRAATRAAWSITCASTPATSAAPWPDCGRSCAASTCRRTRATCGTGCWRAG